MNLNPIKILKKQLKLSEITKRGSRSQDHSYFSSSIGGNEAASASLGQDTSKEFDESHAVDTSTSNDTSEHTDTSDTLDSSDHND